MTETISSLVENPFGDNERGTIQGMIESAPGIRELYEKLDEVARLKIVPVAEADFLLVQKELVGQLIDSINGMGATLPVVGLHFEMLSESYGIRSTVERLYNELLAKI